MWHIPCLSLFMLCESDPSSSGQCSSQGLRSNVGGIILIMSKETQIQNHSHGVLRQ